MAMLHNIEAILLFKLTKHNNEWSGFRPNDFNAIKVGLSHLGIVILISES